MTRRTAPCIAIPIILLSIVLTAPGCSDESAPRSIVLVETINQSEVLDSDVYNNGEDRLPGTEDDYIIEDQVSIVVRNRPHDPVLTIKPNGTFGAVVFTRYEVRFEGDESLAPLFGGIQLRVVSGSSATGIVTIVPAGYKAMPPLLVLRNGGEMRFAAEVTLIGAEEDSGEEVKAVATIPVHCANWVDS